MIKYALSAVIGISFTFFIGCDATDPSDSTPIAESIQIDSLPSFTSGEYLLIAANLAEMDGATEFEQALLENPILAICEACRIEDQDTQEENSTEEGQTGEDSDEECTAEKAKALLQNPDCNFDTEIDEDEIIALIESAGKIKPIPQPNPCNQGHCMPALEFLQHIIWPIDIASEIASIRVLDANQEVLMTYNLSDKIGRNVGFQQRGLGVVQLTYQGEKSYTGPVAVEIISTPAAKNLSRKTVLNMNVTGLP